MKKILYIFNLCILCSLAACSADDSESSGEDTTSGEEGVEVSIAGTVYGSLNDPYNIEIRILSESEVEWKESYTGTDTQTIIESENITGNIIEVQFQLMNFNPETKSGGENTGLNKITVKMEDHNKFELLLNEEVQSLFVATYCIPS